MQFPIGKRRENDNFIRLFIQLILHFDYFTLLYFYARKKNLIMQTKFLLPNRARVWGWIITIPAFIIMILHLEFDFTFPFLDYAAKGVRHISFDRRVVLSSIHFLLGILLIIGLLLIAFSKEKDEDERISRVRLESLLWATLVNSILLSACVILRMACSTRIVFFIESNSMYPLRSWH